MTGPTVFPSRGWSRIALLAVSILSLVSCATCPPGDVPPPEEATPEIRQCFASGFFDESAHMTNIAHDVPILGMVAGRIHSETGPWSGEPEITLEITSLEGEKVGRLTADTTGYFWFGSQLPDGYYCYQATVPGWSAEIGLIELDASSSRRYFTITLPLAK